MIEQRLQELAALVAIGAADEAERAELDAAAQRDPAVAAELAAWQATGAAFGESLEPMAPPAGGLEALRARIASESQASAAPVLSVASPEYAGTAETAEKERIEAPADDKGAEIISLAARRQKRILSSGLAVTLAAAAAFLLLWLRERDRASSAVDEAAAARADRDRVQQDAQREIDQLAKDLQSSGLRLKTLAASFEPLRSPSLKLATLGTEKGGFAHVLADTSKTSEDGKKRWLVFADSLPALGADKDYQLWFVPPEGNPVSAGLLRSEVEGVMSATIEVPAELVGTRLRPAISLEPRGGSKQPTDVKLIGEPI